MEITLVIGGARSGKSSFALNEASKIKGQKAYIATAEALDDEMKERIYKHKKDRGVNWDTYEEPVKISDVLSKVNDIYSSIVIDCLTLWLSNIIQNGMDVEIEINNFVRNLENFEETEKSPRPRVPEFPSHVFIVSNEVGMGIVPDNELAREFRDLAGYLNQKVAEIADEVCLITAGIPIKIK